MDRYTIYCTEDQTKKAYQFGAPIYRLDSESELEARMGNAPSGMFNCGSFEHYRNEEDYPNSVIFETEDWGLAVFYKPTAEQMLGWLRENDVFVKIIKSHGKYGYSVVINEDGNDEIYVEDYMCSNDTYEQAILKAIDASLEYMDKHFEKIMGIILEVASKTAGFDIQPLSFEEHE